MTTDPDAAARLRAEVRAFVRAHHPDVGGDPEEFRRGLVRLRADAVAPGPAGVPDDTDPRLDVPIVAVRSASAYRWGRLGRRLIRRYDPRPGARRVL